MSNLFISWIHKLSDQQES